MLYGRPTKHIRHSDEQTLTIGPQRFQIFQFWKYNDTGTTRVDGLDLQGEQIAPLGSKVTKHKVDVLVTPETVEPQQLYIGRIKLSFGDVYSRAISGGHFAQASYQDETTESFTKITNAITPHIYPKISATDGVTLVQMPSGDQEIGGSGSGKGIKDWLLDDHIKHWVNLKKVTVFDQRPLMGERWQRVPSKVKRINEGTFYGLFIFNDSVRGGTPADTQVKVNIKQYWEELAI